jgi:hypothetical protein
MLCTPLLLRYCVLCPLFVMLVLILRLKTRFPTKSRLFMITHETFFFFFFFFFFFYKHICSLINPQIYLYLQLVYTRHFTVRSTIRLVMDALFATVVR